jgi:hypothetical protein
MSGTAQHGFDALFDVHWTKPTRGSPRRVRCRLVRKKMGAKFGRGNFDLQASIRCCKSEHFGFFSIYSTRVLIRAFILLYRCFRREPKVLSFIGRSDMRKLDPSSCRVCIARRVSSKVQHLFDTSTLTNTPRSTRRLFVLC